jgi:hypothetical protein
MNESLIAVCDAADMLSAAKRVSGFVTRENILIIRVSRERKIKIWHNIENNILLLLP